MWTDEMTNGFTIMINKYLAMKNIPPRKKTLQIFVDCSVWKFVFFFSKRQ